MNSKPDEYNVFEVKISELLKAYDNFRIYGHMIKFHDYYDYFKGIW